MQFLAGINKLADSLKDDTTKEKELKKITYGKY